MCMVPTPDNCAMLKNLFLSAFRNLLKSKFYSLINVLGLTLGLTVGLLILLWVQDELSFDKKVSHSAQIYRVNANMGTAAAMEIWSGVQAPIAIWAKREIPEVKTAVRLKGNYDYTLFRYSHKQFVETTTAYADPATFGLFGIHLLQGNARAPFTDAGSIILTLSQAHKYFGTENAIGKILICPGKMNFSVTGIIPDFPKNSSFQYTMFLPMDRYAKDFKGNLNWKTIDEDWGNFNTETYLLLDQRADPAAVAKKLTNIHNKNQPGSSSTYLLEPLTHLHLYNPDGSSPGLTTVYIFLAISLLILLIACINYVNLSTARSLTRNKEVSMRKIIGASRTQLFLQFVVESGMLFAVATVFSFIIIIIGMPYFNRFTGKYLVALDPSNGSIWVTLSLTLLLTLAAVSIYPAWLLSSFRPIAAIKGGVMPGSGSARFRKVLVTVQFVFSVALIIGTLVIGRQLRYIHQKELGFDKEQVLAFGVQEDMQQHVITLGNELRREPGIQAVCASNSNIIQLGNSTGDTDWEGKDPKHNFIIVQNSIDERFIPFFHLKMIPGSKNFTGGPADSSHFILNETAIREAGIKNPIGKSFVFHRLHGTITGVVKDFHFNSLKEPIKPVILYYRRTDNYVVYVRTTAGAAQKAISAASRLWKGTGTDFPFEYQFLDETFDKLYKSEAITGNLFSFFAAIAILISCLGLYGLAAFTAQTKTREIGIRKVLGASMTGIVSLIGADFLKLVLVAIAVACPLAWLIMKSWLDGFAYRITIGWWMFVVAGVLAVIITLATVSFHAIKAAMASPVKSLRTE